MTPASFYAMVTGHRPDKLGGWGTPNPVETYVRGRVHWFLTRARAAYPDLVMISGMALGADQIVVEECLLLGIPFLAAVPFPGQETRWPSSKQAYYHHLLKQAVEVVEVSPGPYSPGKLHARNEWMAEKIPQDSFALAVWDGSPPPGGTASCIIVLRGLGRRIYQIHPDPKLHREGWVA